MCIQQSEWNSHFANNLKGPRFGDIVTVVEEVSTMIGSSYLLAEWKERYFSARCFIPLSEIDETELTPELKVEDPVSAQLICERIMALPAGSFWVLAIKESIKEGYNPEEIVYSILKEMAVHNNAIRRMFGNQICDNILNYTL